MICKASMKVGQVCKLVLAVYRYTFQTPDSKQQIQMVHPVINLWKSQTSISMIDHSYATFVQNGRFIYYFKVGIFNFLNQFDLYKFDLEKHVETLVRSYK